MIILFVVAFFHPARYREKKSQWHSFVRSATYHPTTTVLTPSSAHSPSATGVCLAEHIVSSYQSERTLHMANNALGKVIEEVIQYPDGLPELTTF